MKLIVVTLIALGMLYDSVLATAASPVPFTALMQPTGVEPGIPPLDDSKNQSTDGSTLPAHKPHMTSGGKMMTCIGAGLMVIGTVVVVGTGIAGLGGFGSSAKIDAGYAGGGGAIVGGAALIILGDHRREAK